jgi:sugar phosphate isomerase/epimerase
MDYGVKHEPGAVAREDWRGMFGDVGRFFAEIRRFGAAFIEMPCGEETDHAGLLEQAGRAAEAGLYVAIHPYFENTMAPEIFDARKTWPGLHRMFATAEAIAGITGHEVPLVFHGGRAHCPPHQVPLDEAFARARAFFTWAETETRRSFPRARVLCETQLPFPDEELPRTRLGDNYADCVRLVEGTGLGLCWDFGHMFLSARQGRSPPVPPAGFLRRVGHVHCHDVIARDGALHDHRPPGTGIAPWRENLGLLAGAGFAAGVLLEIGVAGLGGYGPLGAMLKTAVAAGEASCRARAWAQPRGEGV